MARRALPLALALLAGCSREPRASTDSARADSIAAPGEVRAPSADSVATDTVSPATSRPPVATPSAATRSPARSAPAAGGAATTNAPAAGGGGLTRAPAGPAAGGVRVFPWEMLTPYAVTQLDSVRAAQERAKRAQGRYLSSVGVAPLEGWTARVLFADSAGWGAETVQGFYPARSCVAWGGTPASRAPATREKGRRGEAGKVVCD